MYVDNELIDRQQNKMKWNEINIIEICFTISLLNSMIYFRQRA